MDIEYVAFDSMGVQGSCFRVSGGDDRVIVDPGISMETDAFPLSESERMYLRSTMKNRLTKKAKQANVAAISHYHYDHYTEEPDRKIYGRKRLLLKDPEQDINDEQRERAAELLDGVKGLADRIDHADGRTFYFDGFKLSFGDAMWHGGAGTGMGKVVPMVFKDNATGRSVLYTSDLDGPVEDDAADWIVEQEPDVIIHNGAPTYMLDLVLDYQGYAKGVLNLKRVIEEVGPSKIVLDHHLLRDYRYRDLYRVAFDAARDNGVTMNTAAEELGDQPKVREAYEEADEARWSDWPTPDESQLERLAAGEDPDTVL
ncbi:MAG: MBL fold metallo-hydrolase [Candidatus Nanohaloarchaea archaeon]|nr:MBL fold metallo-hydrolase [Candidatus Nanohaloarchaea archaeon]